MRNRNQRKVHFALLRTHCEDAAFLFTLREKAVEAPNYRIIDVYDVEERMRGHLAAVLHAGRAGAAMAAEVLGENAGSGELFVAAHVVLNRTGARGLIAFLDQWDADLVCQRAFTLALAWCEPPVLSAFMSDWITSNDSRLVALALDVCAEHRVDPRHHLAQALDLPDPRARAAAVRVAGCCGRDDLLHAVAACVEDRGCVGWEAAISATLLGSRSVAPHALFAAVAADPMAPRARLAAELAPLGLERDDAQELVRSLLNVAETARWGVVAVGSLGAAASLDWLVRRMSDPLLARVAGAAFGVISGADLKDPELERPEFPEDPENAITDANPVEAFYEGNLPWPEIERLAAWLDANRRRFSPDTRHLFGLPAWSYQGTDLGKMRYQAQFRLLALELAIRNASAPLPNWQAPVKLKAGRFVRKW